MTRKTTVTPARAETVLTLVAGWLGKHGLGTPVCPDGHRLDTTLRHDDGTECVNCTFGPAPTGLDAAYRGLGPMLNMEWDWSGKPTPTILLEGGPYDWAVDCCIEINDLLAVRGIPVRTEPYAGYALSIYPD